MTKPQERFTVGNQPCQNFLRGDADIAALGEGNRRNLHQCPKCSGNRAWCDNCNTDHHDGGWEACKPGAFEEDWADERAETIIDEVCKPNWKNGGVLVMDRLDRIEYVAKELRYAFTQGEEGNRKQSGEGCGSQRPGEKMIQAARDLVDNIRENGVHDNWKTLANELKE